MCLVLKLDNGKVVSIANEQTDRIKDPSSTVLVYRFDLAIYGHKEMDLCQELGRIKLLL